MFSFLKNFLIPDRQKKKPPPKNSTPRKTIKKGGKQKIFEGLLCARHQGKKKVQHSFHSPKARTRGVAEPSQGQGKVTENVAYFKCFTFNKSMSSRGKKIQSTIFILGIR